MKSSIALKASLIAALSAGLCLTAGCNRKNIGAGSAASDTSGGRARVGQIRGSRGGFAAMAKSDAPSGASNRGHRHDDC
ncbi:hypothetical protein [Caballeronia sp. S22]|uniref:hypothetical protein n=1 Tax=Caballeronia sp. S22 TaxID=3137182 RepID=UPI0035309935